jgi:hypothetical protein
VAVETLGVETRDGDVATLATDPRTTDTPPTPRTFRQTKH